MVSYELTVNAFKAAGRSYDAKVFQNTAIKKDGGEKPLFNIIKNLIWIIQTLIIVTIFSSCTKNSSKIQGEYRLEDTFKDTLNNTSLYLTLNKKNKYYIAKYIYPTNEIIGSSIISTGCYKLLKNGNVILKDKATKYEVLLLKNQDSFVVSRGYYFIINKQFKYYSKHIDEDKNNYDESNYTYKLNFLDFLRVLYQYCPK